jgi:hypothetical protein
MFFFEKKNQKTFACLASLYPEKPKPKKHRFQSHQNPPCDRSQYIRLGTVYYGRDQKQA